jgi:hypothetical protein
VFVTEKVNKNHRILPILECMKRFVLIGWVLLGASVAQAQVFFRNDFIINNRQHRIENRGLRYISINLSNHPNMNQLINGRGGATLVIDVRALREPKRKYSYTEIAEKIYVPATITDMRVIGVPQFLLQKPPVRRMFFIPTKRTLALGI